MPPVPGSGRLVLITGLPAALPPEPSHPPPPQGGSEPKPLGRAQLPVSYLSKLPPTPVPHHHQRHLRPQGSLGEIFLVSFFLLISDCGHRKILKSNVRNKK